MEKETKQEILHKWKTGKKIGKDQYLIFILIGVLLMVVALPTSEKGEKAGRKASDIRNEEEEKNSWPEEEIQKDSETESYEQYIENKLEQAISVMEGAGKTKVLVTVSASKEEVVEKDIPTVKNNTVEKDAEGGSRNVNESDSREETVYVKKSDGTSAPYVKKTLQPVIEGVLVVSQGGDNPKVKKNITEAIVALFDIEPHKIIVAKMKPE